MDCEQDVRKMLKTATIKAAREFMRDSSCAVVLTSRSYCGFAMSVQDELPLASASGRKKLKFSGFSRMRKTSFPNSFS
jgi:hypothetical protein